MNADVMDVIIIGAGLSGIGAAWRLQERCSDLTYTVLEGRADLGGTWDLFRYPGVRSDSDMMTLGYPFRPWRAARTIAPGADILAYIRETAEAGGVLPHIRFRHRVVAASWSSAEALWTLQVQVGASGDGLPIDAQPTDAQRTDALPSGAVCRLRCRFLYACCGYYDYAQGHAPAFPGMAAFAGQLVHPQHWPADLDHAGKQVVVIGSGATAMTLVPALAASAARVTLLQRSPSYVASLPARDRWAERLRRILPEGPAHGIVRWKNVLVSLAFYQFCRRWPDRARAFLRTGVVRQLPAGYPVDRHFRPRYQPWDERLCLVPNGDLFRAIRAGTAEVVTDEIASFTPTGIRLQSGQVLPADIVVSATGLTLQAAGGIRFLVDARPVDLSRALVYRGVLLQGLPNLALCVGYTNASWTLRADLSTLYVCRLLRHLRRQGLLACVPRCDAADAADADFPRPLLNLHSSYVRRGQDVLPKQGARAPWLLRQNYLLDRLDFALRGVTEPALQFFAAGAHDGLAAVLAADSAVGLPPDPPAMPSPDASAPSAADTLVSAPNAPGMAASASGQPACSGQPS